MTDKIRRSPQQDDALLFLTDDQLLQGIELMYFAYKSFTSDPDRILADYTYGRAHHRALYFINRYPGLRVSDLLDILSITKQSLNRVLRQLIKDNLVSNQQGKTDRRERNLYLTDKGYNFERELSNAQRARMRAAYRAAGANAVQGFRRVLEEIIEMKTHHLLHRIEANDTIK